MHCAQLYCFTSLVPRPSQHFQHCMRKAVGPGIRSHVTNFVPTCMKGSQRVRMNVAKPMVNEVQHSAIYHLLEVRLKRYRLIVRNVCKEESELVEWVHG